VATGGRGESDRASPGRLTVGVLWLGKVSSDTGGRTYLTEILRALALEPDLAIDVHVADRAFVVPSGCRAVYHRVPWLLGTAGRALAESFVGMRELRSCDVLLAPFGNVPPTWRGPTVVVAHDVFAAGTGVRTELGRLRAWYRPRALRVSLKRATKVLTVSAYLRELLLESFPALAAANVEVVPLGAPQTSTASSSSEPRVQKRVLAVSALSPYKRIDQAIAAFAEATGDLDAVLEIAGPDVRNQRNALEALAAERGIASRVVFLGNVPHDRLQTLYRESDALLFLSEIESFGLPVLEAMAAGLPVIAKPIEALVEIGGDAPLWVSAHARTDEIAAALRKLLLDPELHAERSRAGRKQAEGFTWSRAGASTAAALRKAGAWS
jgi:glycosyltransferase involved in cell wall biosynthesis